MAGHDNPIPEPSGWDHAQVALKAAISAIPIAGSPAAELFAAIIAPPLAHRRDQWLQSLADGLSELQCEFSGFKPESLASNEAFVSVVMRSSRAAVQTHRKEKLEALRNAVLNMAVARSPDEDEQEMFLEYVETLSVWHLRLLQYFQAPLTFAKNAGARTDYMKVAGAQAETLVGVFPELRERADFYDQIVRDLGARGLIIEDDRRLHTLILGEHVLAKWTTERADRFIAFIKSPV